MSFSGPGRGLRIALRQRRCAPWGRWRFDKSLTLRGSDAMFDSLQKRLGAVFDKLRGRGALSEADVDAALAEVRTALIDADVALPVVKDFIAGVRSDAVGEEVIRSITPGQQVVKIVHDRLVQTLGEQSQGLSLGAPPAPILMVGL